VPPLLAKPRHAKPRELPAAKAVLVPVVLMGSTGSALGGLAMSASAADKPVAVTAASSQPVSVMDAELLLDQRTVQAEQRASRDRAAAAQKAAAEAAAADAARVAAEQAAAAEAARVAAEQAAAAEAARVEAEAQAAAARRTARPGDGRLTSGYGPRWGRMHRGIDLAAGTGAPIRAAAAGTVISAGTEQGYGRAVRIRHADGSETLYAHNSSILVRAGQKVAAGQQISREGATGNVTGPHLHFEVRVGGSNVNPLTWLRQHGVSI
jgi:murein DD-endopeptidase MepM/ murein hydrolase activator NlpD